MEVKINLVISFDANASEVLSHLANALTAKQQVSQEVIATPQETKKPIKKTIEKPVVEAPKGVVVASVEGLTIEDLRKILGEKSRAGYKQEIEEILISYGSRVLKNIDPVYYEEIAAKVEAIQ